MKGATLSLLLVCFTGCATKRAWLPVEAEQGLIYGSSSRAETNRWPVATTEYYGQKFYAPEITKAISENQQWEYMGKRVEFKPAGENGR